MLNQKAEMGNQSLINLKTIRLARYPLSGKSQGFVSEMKKKKTFQNMREKPWSIQNMLTKDKNS